jgi:tyrosine-protein kinase Etk/Wzc
MQEKINISQSKKLDIFRLIISVFKNIKTILIINLFVLIIAILVILLSVVLPSDISFLPNKYTSETKILIPSKEDDRSSPTDIAELASPESFSLEKGVKKSQVIISILSTNTIIDGVLDNYYLPKHPKLEEAFKNKKISREALRLIILKNAKFKKDDTTGFIFINYNDTNPTFAKEMVDTFLTMLNKATHDFALTQTVIKRRFIEERLKDINEKQEQAKNDFIKFQQEYGIISPENEAQQITNSVASLRSQLINKEAELDNYRRINKLGPNEKTDLDYEVADLRNKILKLTKSSNENINDKNLIISKNTISELSSEYNNLKSNVENIYSSLLKELELAQIQEKSEGSFIQVIDPPEIPTRKSGPSRSILLFQIVIISLLITFLFPVSIDLFKQYILENGEIKKKIDLLVSYLKMKQK